MLKKIVASAVAAGLIAGHTAAMAAPVAIDSSDRSAAALDGAEGLEGGSEVWLILLFALVAAGIIVLIEGNEGDVDDLPASP